MRKTIGIVSVISRLAGGVQLALGALFWTGHAYTYVPVHMAIGSLFVLGLCTLAVIALVAKVKPRLAVFEIVWALALAGFGMRQAAILIGPMHWIVRVVHLSMAFSAMGVAAALTKALLAAAPQSDRPGEVERGTVPVRRAS